LRELFAFFHHNEATATYAFGYKLHDDGNAIQLSNSLLQYRHHHHNNDIMMFLLPVAAAAAAAQESVEWALQIVHKLQVCYGNF